MGIPRGAKPLAGKGPGASSHLLQGAGDIEGPCKETLHRHTLEAVTPIPDLPPKKSSDLACSYLGTGNEGSASSPPSASFWPLYGQVAG